MGAAPGWALRLWHPPPAHGLAPGQDLGTRKQQKLLFFLPPPGSSSAEHLKICVILYQQSVPLRNSLRLLYLNRPCLSHEPLGSQPLALTQQNSRSPSSAAVPALLPLPQEHGRAWDFIFPNTHPCRGAELHPGMSPYCPAQSTCSVSRGISGNDTTRHPRLLARLRFQATFHQSGSWTGSLCGIPGGMD